MIELVEGVTKLFQQEFSHSETDPLGKRWRNHEKRRCSDWNDEAAKVCPDWTEDYLEQLLDSVPAHTLSIVRRNKRSEQIWVRE
eukprot:CAMPEP_0196158214 /NCGR_PEP_ID=MMETSP0910-20130528/45430_1 /TAXON_ID=49265 /ORGANISM="Thalassiosira rotula, Strain GSO102" /LENGTH=83 /DNA_ID=CAMNT_0041423067 /DNA_START=188 /DNA_END=439 /DNA_ORIENTATION=+